ncbi:hypothetical protein KIMH_02100 [Bombiscardovia apis]|uniref:ABC transporter permease n=1 Tax=Bombiscardovia apis TaxID=2932182 RepID=A0ABM8BB76_9BIFI|nr:hypothetical protein [Bombiscardovia apis]BDR54099.1 hypothetical protein KIMH_02100 [Bombiscardovia apis]
MKVHTILSEAWRDIASGTNRTILWLLTLSFVSMGILGLDLGTIVALQNQSKMWTTSGAAINLVQSEGQISSTSCIALHQTTTAFASKQSAQPQHPAIASDRPIGSSGALKAGPLITLSAMPAAPLESFNVTPSLAVVLRLTPSVDNKTGVWISSQLAETLQVRAGDILATDSGPMHVAAVFSWPQDSRDQRIAYAILNPSTSQEPFDECWATVAPSNTAASDLLTATAISTPGTMNPLQIKQVNNSLGSSFDGWEQYRKRASKYLTVALPFTALLLGFISVRTRRVEIADDLHCGIKKGSIWAIFALETWAWSLAALVSCAAVLLLVVRSATSHNEALQLLAVETPMLVAALILAQVGLALALLPIKANQLFTYFKERR